jgi:hypothetical protein
MEQQLNNTYRGKTEELGEKSLSRCYGDYHTLQLASLSAVLGLRKLVE